MVLTFILLLLLAIWAAFKFGGVRKVDEAEVREREEREEREKDEKRREKKRREKEEKEKEEEESGLFRGKGGKFGGGGASGGW